LWSKERADVSDGFPEVVDCSGSGFPQEGLALREGHFDGVEVGTVGRQKQQPCAPVPDERLGPLAFVAGEIVQDDDVAGLEGRGKLGLDVSLEDGPVHRRVNDPGRDKAVALEARDQGLGGPVAERRFGMQALAFRAASAGSCHLGVGAGFVEKDQPRALSAHQGLAAFFPLRPRLDQVRPVLLACPKSFF
jgi:hypothetical protein